MTFVMKPKPKKPISPGPQKFVSDTIYPSISLTDFNKIVNKYKQKHPDFTEDDIVIDLDYGYDDDVSLQLIGTIEPNYTEFKVAFAQYEKDYVEWLDWKNKNEKNIEQYKKEEAKQAKIRGKKRKIASLEKKIAALKGEIS